MRKALLEYLCCPRCREELTSEDSSDVLLAGFLFCSSCDTQYEIINGVPQLLVEATEEVSHSVAESFAIQWQEYSEKRPMYRQQFLDWLNPVTAEFFEDKLVLDVGCGKGRHLLESASFGARLVVGVDLGFGSTQVAEEASREFSNTSVVRADIYNLPFRDGVFDYAYAVGVLHHLPDPRLGFKSMVNSVRPGGHVSAWVYGLENNEWIVKYVNPFRIHIASRLPEGALRVLSAAAALILKFVGVGVYKPLEKLLPSVSLFYREYITYISSFPLREIETIVYDHLHPEIAFYLSQAEFGAWFDGFVEPQISWHNKNSWRGFAQLPPSEKAIES